MDMNTKTTATKPANETYEKMSAATTEAADVIKNTYSTAVKGAQDYNNKLVEFTQRTLMLPTTLCRNCPV